MRAFEFIKPLSIQQAREKALKRQAKDAQVRLKKERLQKQRERVRATAQALAKAHSQTF